MVIPPALLGEDVTVRRFTRAADDEYGHPTGTWADVATLRARVEFATSDVLDGERTLRRTAARAFVDGAPDVRLRDTLVWEGRTFDVVGVLPRRLNGATAFVRLELVEAV